MEKYTFRDCTLALLEDEFGLRKAFTSQILDQWLATEIPLTDTEKIILENYQTPLVLHADTWNEEELLQLFIGPVFGLVQFTVAYRFRFFAERKIKADVPGLEKEIELSGEPDGIIATGYREPKVPMFAFSEYKRALDPNGDPAGQALGAMLVEQTLNHNQQPLYGAYVIGSDWRFMVLQDRHYTISRNYSALTDELFDIFRILKALKEIVMALTEG